MASEFESLVKKMLAIASVPGYKVWEGVNLWLLAEHSGKQKSVEKPKLCDKLEFRAASMIEDTGYRDSILPVIPNPEEE